MKFFDTHIPGRATGRENQNAVIQVVLVGAFVVTGVDLGHDLWPGSGKLFDFQIEDEFSGIYALWLSMDKRGSMTRVWNRNAPVDKK